MDYIGKIFRAKHWEIFSTLIFISFVQSISEEFSNVTSMFFYILYILFYIGWLLILGTGLKSIQRNAAMNYSVFLATGFILIAVVVAFRLLAMMDILDIEQLGQGPTVLIMLTFILASLTILCSYIAKNLKLNERGNDIDVNDYFGDIFLLIFWPIGIWTIQPRINRLADKLASR